MCARVWFVHGTTQQWASVLAHVAGSLVRDRIASVTQWTGLQPCLPLHGRKALPIRVGLFSSSSSSVRACVGVSVGVREATASCVCIDVSE